MTQGSHSVKRFVFLSSFALRTSGENSLHMYLIILRRFDTSARLLAFRHILT